MSVSDLTLEYPYRYVTGGGALKYCEHCGSCHVGVCPRIKMIEYHPNGVIKRVEYHAVEEHQVPVRFRFIGEEAPRVYTDHWAEEDEDGGGGGAEP